MNARILRIELRRTIAGWAGLVAVVIALGFLYSFSGPWSKEPLAWNEHGLLAASWSRFLLVFLWPIAIGAGVLQGMRDSRSGMTELLTTMSRPGRHRAAKLAAALAGVLVLGYLLIFAVGAVQVAFHDGFVGLGWLPVLLVGVLAMCAGAWLGLGLGKLLPHPLTAPAAAVAAFVATAVLQFVPANGNPLEGAFPIRVALLAPAFNVYDPFLTTASRMDLGQAIWFLGMAVTGFLLLTAVSVRAKALAVLPAVAGLVIAVPVLPTTVAEARVPDPSATAQVCDGPVCVTRMHEDQLARLAEPGREALRLLGTLPEAPVRVVELDQRLEPGEVPPRAADVVLVDLVGTSARVHTEPGDLTRSLLAGAGTPSCYSSRGQRGEPFMDELAARTIMASWFLGEFEPLKGYRLAGDDEMRSWTALRALPEDEQRRRIIAARRAGLTCQGNQLEILTGGVTR